MKRNLDGIYFRVERNGHWENCCLSDMKPEETKNVLNGFEKDELVRTIQRLAERLHTIGEITGLYISDEDGCLHQEEAPSE